MREKLIHTLISATVGASAAGGGVWLLQDPGASVGKTDAEKPAAEKMAIEHFDELEVERLKVTGGIWVCHSETGEPLIELKDGVVLAKSEVLSRYVGGMEIVGRKLQITTGDPSAADPPIFCELGAGDGGQGAYIALLSPKGTHSVNVGFDKNETGFVVSRNNDDTSMTAQAVLPIPQKRAERRPKTMPSKNLGKGRTGIGRRGTSLPYKVRQPKRLCYREKRASPGKRRGRNIAMEVSGSETSDIRKPTRLPISCQRALIKQACK